jgi:hypothetical protein
VSGAQAVMNRRPETGTVGRRARRPGSLASPFLRHALVGAIAGVGAYLLARHAPAPQQPLAWLLAGVIVGAVAGPIGRNFLGVLFAITGWIIGLLLELHLRLGAGPAAADELMQAAITHLAALGLLSLTYTAGVLVIVVARRR